MSGQELELETSASPERTEELLRNRELRQSEKQVWDACGKMRAGSHVEAWDMLQKWLASRGNAPEDYRWLCGRLGSWGDPRYVTRMTQDYIERLLALKRNGEALDTAARRLADDPSFRPKTAAATLQIAQIAAGGAVNRGWHAPLLADFPGRFEGDPCVSAAAALARHLE